MNLPSSHPIASATNRATAILLLGMGVAASLSAASPPIDYAAKIAPLFQEYCSDCHGNDDPDGKFNLETHESLMQGGKSGKVIEPGHSQESLLVKFLEGRSGKEGKNQFMPPGKRDHLKPEQIALIRQWIDLGAPAPATPAKPGDVLDRIPKILPKGDPKRAVRALAVASKGAVLAVGRFGVIELLNSENREILRTIKDIAGSVNSLAFSSDGQTLFAAAGDAGLTGIAYQFRVSDGQLLHKYEGHTDALYALALSPDGRLLATGGYDQKIKLWTIETGAEWKVLKGHNGCIYGLSFRPDGKVLASASADRTVKLWEVATGNRLDTFSQPLKEQQAVAFAPDGKTLVAGGSDNRIRRWSISEKALEGSNPILESRYAHEGALLSLAYSADGQTLVSGAADRTVKIWNTADLSERKVLETQPDWPPALAILPSGRFVSGRLDGSLGYYQLADGAPVPAPASPKKTMAVAKKKGASKKAAMGDPDLPRVTPAGVQIGSSAVLKVSGFSLEDVKSVKFLCPCFKAEVLNLNPDGTGFDLKVTVEASLKPGSYDFSLVTSKGETSKLKLYADTVPQKTAPSQGHAPMTLEGMPVDAWGQLTETGQQDSYKFHAESGQTIVLDLAVKRVESKAQTPLLQLFDVATNKLIAANSGLDSGADPFLAFTAPKTGDYIARVSETTLEGSPNHVYRLTAGALPYVVGFWPLSLPANAQSKVRLVGYNLKSEEIALQTSAPGEMTLPLDTAEYRTRVPLNVVVSDMKEVLEQEPNDDVAHATLLTPPVSVNGRLFSEVHPEAPDVDLYAFDAKKDQSLVIETRAAMLGSPADTKIEILDATGKPVPHLLLAAMRDSAINFRSVDANNPDIRLDNWREMGLNQFVYLNGDIIRIFRMPRGPDSGILFYAEGGKRRSYFNTSATAHSLDEPCYVVEAKPVGTSLAPNGLPVFTLNYENDDDAERKLGKDSRLIFTAPATGRYHVRVTDTRGWSGDRYAYRLILREPKPDFKATLTSTRAVKVSAGGGVSMAVKADREDGFDGDIRVDVSGVPAGVFVSSPIVIQGGHSTANGCLYAYSNAKLGELDLSKVKITATAEIGGQTVVRPLEGFASVAVGAPLKQSLFLEPDAGGHPQGDGKTVPEKPYEIVIHPGTTVSAWLRADRHGNDALISMDVENLPHGVIVDNIGLNGVQIREKENEREIFLSCAKWVPDQDRLCHIISGSARNDANRTGTEETSFPVLLKIRSEVKMAATGK